MEANTREVDDEHIRARQALAAYGINDPSKPVSELINELAARHRELRAALEEISWVNMLSSSVEAVDKCVELAQDALRKDAYGS